MIPVLQKWQLPPTEDTSLAQGTIAPEWGSQDLNLHLNNPKAYLFLNSLLYSPPTGGC